MGEPTVTLTVPLEHARALANGIPVSDGVRQVARKAVEEYDEAHRPRYEALATNDDTWCVLDSRNHHRLVARFYEELPDAEKRAFDLAAELNEAAQ